MRRPHDHTEPWDDSDLAELLHLRGTMTLRQIADRMGRTYNAVRSKLYRLDQAT